MLKRGKRKQSLLQGGNNSHSLSVKKKSLHSLWFTEQSARQRENNLSREPLLQDDAVSAGQERSLTDVNVCASRGFCEVAALWLQV